MGDKVALLERWSRRLLDAPAVDHVTASVLAVTEDKHYADLGGTTADPATGTGASRRRGDGGRRDGGGFETMRTVAPPIGPRLGVPAGDEGWDWDGELASLPELLAEKWPPRRCRPAPTTWSSTRPTCG